jgi:hypothetical protein
LGACRRGGREANARVCKTRHPGSIPGRDSSFDGGARSTAGRRSVTAPISVQLRGIAPGRYRSVAGQRFCKPPTSVRFQTAGTFRRVSRRSSRSALTRVAQRSTRWRASISGRLHRCAGRPLKPIGCVQLAGRLPRPFSYQLGYPVLSREKRGQHPHGRPIGARSPTARGSRPKTRSSEGWNPRAYHAPVAQWSRRLP